VDKNFLKKEHRKAVASTIFFCNFELTDKYAARKEKVRNKETPKALNCYPDAHIHLKSSGFALVQFEFKCYCKGTRFFLGLSYHG
jgi:hypothetical protein